MTTEITFNGIVPGLNGSNGLIRMHWSKKKKLKEQFFWVAKAANATKHKGQVSMSLMRYSSSKVEMDFDNLVSTGKLILDAIVESGIILDDNKKIISQRSYDEIRCKKGEERTVITISDV